MNRWHYESRTHVMENINTIALDTIQRILWDQPSTPKETKLQQIDGIIQLVFRIGKSIGEEANNDASTGCTVDP